MSFVLRDLQVDGFVADLQVSMRFDQAAFAVSAPGQADADSLAQRRLPDLLVQRVGHVALSETRLQAIQVDVFDTLGELPLAVVPAAAYCSKSSPTERTNSAKTAEARFRH